MSTYLLEKYLGVPSTNGYVLSSTIAGVRSWIALSFLSNTFESVSKNLNSYPYVITYSGADINYITYTLGGGLTIVKTFNYTSGDITSIVLSGSTPSGISLTKTLAYSGGNVSSITYS